MSRNFIITGSSLTIVIGVKPYIIDKSHKNYELIKDGIRTNKDDETLLKLIDVSTVINEYTQGKIKVVSGQVYYKDSIVKNTLTDRMLVMMDEGFNIDSMCRFMDNLHQNPSKTAVDELYLFLECCNLPITEDGHFLAYKKVKSDYKDIHSGTFDNSVGQKPQMDRNMVDDNRNNTCSQGLHFASYSYMSSFGNGTTDRVVILKINPADVVSIPSDYNNAKGRCWQYEVIGEVPNDGKTQIKNDCVATRTVRPKSNIDSYKDIKTLISKALYSNTMTVKDVIDLCKDFEYDLEKEFDGLNYNQIANKVREYAIDKQIDVDSFVALLDYYKVDDTVIEPKHITYDYPTISIKDTSYGYNSTDNNILLNIKNDRIKQYINNFGGNYSDLVSVSNTDLRVAIETRKPLFAKQEVNDVAQYDNLLRLVESALKKPNMLVWNNVINKFSNDISDILLYKSKNDYKGIIKQIKGLIKKGVEIKSSDFF